MRPGEKFTLSHIWQVFSDYLSGRISQPFAMLGGLLTVILFAALLQGIQDDPKRRAVGQVYEFVCALAAVAVLAEPLCQSFAAVESALSQGASFMTLFVPVFAGILAAGGTVTSAVSYQTARGSPGGRRDADDYPCAAAVLHHGLFTGNRGCRQSVCVRGRTAAAVPEVYHLGAGVADDLVSGGAFHAELAGRQFGYSGIQNHQVCDRQLCAVVGNAVSDAYTTVRSSLQILRSTTGVIGIVSLCVLFLPPLVQLLLYRAVVAVGAAAAELFGTKSLLRLLRGTQQALAIAFALLVCFGIMFVVATAIAMTIGKGAA